jgi:hypothetical protein
MPVSNGNNISPIVNEIVRLKPKKIIDLGAGKDKRAAAVEVAELMVKNTYQVEELMDIGNERCARI